MILSIIVAVVILTLIVVGKYVLPCINKKKSTRSTIPGLEPSHLESGNVQDVGIAGSIHDFLMMLHGKYGNIASFWWGKQFCVSIASPDLFKEHNKSFNRPKEFHILFEPIFLKSSITYAVDNDWHHRRQSYDKAFTHHAITGYYDCFKKKGVDVVRMWNDIPKGQHIPLLETMFSVSSSTTAITSFGDLFEDESESRELARNYFICWREMEMRLSEGFPAEGSERQNKFEKALSEMHNVLRKAIGLRKKKHIKPGEEILIDLIMNSTDDESVIFGDCLTYLVAATHTDGLLLAWSLYQLAINSEIQERVYSELVDVLEQEDVSPENINSLHYMRQVLDETLRWSVLAPYATRFDYKDIVLGGHSVPGGTPVVEALGVVLQDPNIWPDPTNFDPDRFSGENSKKRSPYAFQPFGFAGKRKCPGHKYSHHSVIVFLSIILRNFKMKLVEGQNVVPVYGLVTIPKEEVWMYLEKR